MEHPLATVWEVEGIVVRDSTSHVLRLMGIDPIDVDEALDTQAMLNTALDFGMTPEQAWAEVESWR